MFNYLVGFSVYTLAMIGIIFIGFVVVKKCSMAKSGAKSHNNFLEIETSLSIEPRKTIHVIRAGSERILLATDAENTRFLTKLNISDPENVVSLESVRAIKNNSMKDADDFELVDLSIGGDDSFSQQSVFKDLMKRLQK